MCILSVYTLQKVVGLYDLSVSDGSPKKSLDGELVGGVSSINFFNFAKPLSESCGLIFTSSKQACHWGKKISDTFRDAQSFPARGLGAL